MDLRTVKLVFIYSYIRWRLKNTATAAKKKHIRSWCIQVQRDILQWRRHRGNILHDDETQVFDASVVWAATPVKNWDELQ